MPESGRQATAEALHRACGASPLAAVLPLLNATLEAIADESMHKIVVTDARGRVLWRVAGRPVRVRHRWTCAACPIRDPGTGSVIGAVDLSRPARGFHPATIALVAAAARLAEGHLAVREMVAGMTPR